MAHTPGPWKAEPITKNSAPNERPWVGRLEESRYAALSCGETQAEAVANARLIAAAPDLLQVVQTFVAAVDGDATDYHSLTAAARAALAAARQESAS